MKSLARTVLVVVAIPLAFLALAIQFVEDWLSDRRERRA